MTSQLSGIEELLASVSVHGLDGAIGALLGSIVAALIAWRFGDHAAKWSRTMELHKEFNSDKLASSRIEAFSFIKANWGLSFVAISERDDLAASSAPLFAVFHFYERLWLAMQYKQIHKKAVVDLFGEVFVWWYVIVFRQQLLSTNWHGASSLLSMYGWLERQTARTTWNQWIARHQAEYEQLRERYGTQALRPVNRPTPQP